jgi:hypothetical protein
MQKEHHHHHHHHHQHNHGGTAASSSSSSSSPHDPSGTLSSGPAKRGLSSAVLFTTGPAGVSRLCASAALRSTTRAPERPKLGCEMARTSPCVLVVALVWSVRKLRNAAEVQHVHRSVEQMREFSKSVGPACRGCHMVGALQYSKAGSAGLVCTVSTLLRC